MSFKNQDWDQETVTDISEICLFPVLNQVPYGLIPLPGTMCQSIVPVICTISSHTDYHLHQLSNTHNGTSISHWVEFKTGSLLISITFVVTRWLFVIRKYLPNSSIEI